MSTLKQRLLERIQEQPGRDKIELAQHFSVTPFEITAPLNELEGEGKVIKRLARGRVPTYHPLNRPVPPLGAA